MDLLEDIYVCGESEQSDGSSSKSNVHSKSSSASTHKNVLGSDNDRHAIDGDSQNVASLFMSGHGNGEGDAPVSGGCGIPYPQRMHMLHMILPIQLAAVPIPMNMSRFHMYRAAACQLMVKFIKAMLLFWALHLSRKNVTPAAATFKLDNGNFKGV